MPRHEGDVQARYTYLRCTLTYQILSRSLFPHSHLRISNPLDVLIFQEKRIHHLYQPKLAGSLKSLSILPDARASCTGIHPCPRSTPIRGSDHGHKPPLRASRNRSHVFETPGLTADDMAVQACTMRHSINKKQQDSTSHHLSYLKFILTADRNQRNHLVLQSRQTFRTQDAAFPKAEPRILAQPAQLA